MYLRIFISVIVFNLLTPLDACLLPKPKTSIKIINYDTPTSTCKECPPETQTQNVYVINVPDQDPIPPSPYKECHKQSTRKCCPSYQNYFPSYQSSTCNYDHLNLLPNLETPCYAYEANSQDDSNTDNGKICFSTLTDEGTITVTFERNDCQCQSQNCGCKRNNYFCSNL